MTLVVARATGHVSDSRFEAFLRNREGPVQRMLQRKADLVQNFQIRHAPRRTGRLASTSRTDRGFLGIKPHVDVIMGRDGLTDYLGYVLFGTPPHRIAARNDRPNPHLRFMVGGGVRFAREVQHPGTRANNFMLDSLPEALK